MVPTCAETVIHQIQDCKPQAKQYLGNQRKRVFLELEKKKEGVRESPAPPRYVVVLHEGTEILT